MRKGHKTPHTNLRRMFSQPSFWKNEKEAVLLQMNHGYVSEKADDVGRVLDLVKMWPQKVEGEQSDKEKESFTIESGEFSLF